MSLLDCWPTEKHVLECIKPEAENPLDAVFLAVHQPMKLTRRHFDKGSSKPGNEQDVLRDFLREDVPTGTLLMPILGDSGIGKSHLVRWLDVQLRQRSDRDKRHVIRIPKSSSLKSVLKRVLDGLVGPRYEQIRQQLQAAREQMDQIQATERIIAELRIAIRRRAERAKDRKADASRSGERVRPDDELWVGHGDDRCLPALLSDAVTSRLFVNRPGDRPGIIDELARHLTQDTRVEEAPRRQFDEEDFETPQKLASEIATSASPLARNYLHKLQRSNGRARQQALSLLNDIIDDAIKPLATPDKTSLSELFYDVRRELLAEGRELVLLVEDFAVLAGIQGALLDAMIREGVRGEQEACVMRTVLAVTEGYFKSFETVRTRAVYAWYVDSVTDEDEEDTIDRMCDFVGAYLNAARFGAKELERRCAPDAHDQSWVPDFVDEMTLKEEESQQLEAFGRSPTGRSLFPFNRNAIREVADWRMRDVDARLVFNPRSIINELLVPVLKEHRHLLADEQFPPEWFLSYDPNSLDAELRHQVTEKHRDPQVHNRLFPLLRFWGGNPRDLSEVDLPKGVYEAFSLPSLDGATGKVPTPRVKRPKVDKKKPPEKETPEQGPTTDAGERNEVHTWFERLDAWAQGTPLGHQDANQLRKMIVDSVLAAIDWDALLLKPLSTVETGYLKEWVFLPNAKGAQQCTPENAFAVIATANEFENEARRRYLVLALRAVIRYHYFKNWNYESADVDFARYGNLLEALSWNAGLWLQDSYRKVDGDPVPALVEALLIGARILNIEPAHSREDAPLVHAIFAPSNRPPEGTSDWDQLRSECHQWRETMQVKLLARLGARQGGGSKVFAVNAAPLLGAIKRLKSDWKPMVKFPSHRSSEESLARIDTHIKELSRHFDKAVSSRRSEILTAATTIQQALGDDSNKQELVDALKQIIQLARQLAIKDPQDNFAELERLVEEFRAAPVSECLQYVQRIQQEKDGGTLLSALAQIDESTLGLATDFVVRISGVLDRLKRKIQGELDTLGEDIVQNAVNNLDSKFQALEKAMPSVLERTRV